MRFKIESLSSIGNYRKTNQDFTGYCENKKGALMAIVADGMGGHAHGEVASKIAVESFLKKFKLADFKDLSDQEINLWMRNCIKEILKEMIEYSSINIETKDMGTTLTSIVFANNKAYVLNIGDSRTYRLHNNKLSLITKDQNLWNDTKDKSEKRDEIKKFLGHKFNELTYWKVLTSALGPNKNLKVDTYLVKEPSGFYMLSTDGVHDYIDKQTLKEMLGEKAKLKHKAKEILSYALGNLSTDNLSLILIDASGEKNEQ